jgi:hypothetical protein
MWHDAYCQIEKISKIQFKFNYKIQHIHTNEEDDVNLKSKSSHPLNIRNDDIDDDIGDMCPLTPITNTLHIKNMI